LARHMRIKPETWELVMRFNTSGSWPYENTRNNARKFTLAKQVCGLPTLPRLQVLAAQELKGSGH